MKKTQPYFYGGQAVMEGVMMRGRSWYAMAVRKPDGTIEIREKKLKPAAERFPLLKWPIVRGVVAFVDSLSVGIRTLTQSAEIAGDSLTESEEPSRFERFLTEKLGDKLNNVIIQCSVVLAALIAMGLFMLLPTWIGSLFTPLLGGYTGWLGVIEGLVRIGIFILYVYAITLSKDIRRVFEYHGAEHKTINCYEKGESLTVENIAKFPRLHKRCGTGFLLVVMMISMLVFMFVRTDNLWLRFASRIILLPLIAGLAYEVSVKWAGRYDNWLVRAVVFPGMCLQRLTTAEPDAAQIETAMTALTTVLALEVEGAGHVESTAVEPDSLEV